MRRAMLLVLATLVMMLSAGGIAQAQLVLQPIGVTTDPAVLTAMRVATIAWGTPACEPSEVLLYANTEFSAVTLAPRCQIGFSKAFLDSKSRYADKRLFYLNLCKIAVHEKGHLRGYVDNDPRDPMNGIMSYAKIWNAYVPLCITYSYNMMPRLGLTKKIG